MAGKLEGKAAIVTGASSGIGEATALALAEEGAKVALVARRADRLETLAKQIESRGGTALVLVADVADEAQIADAVNKAHAAFGRVDILINNAGVMLLGPIDGADTEDFRRMVNVNILGLMYGTHAVLPIMKAQQTGHIVNISSVAGRVTRSVSAVYSATKHAVGAFSEGLRQQALKDNIRVTIIEPGVVITELTDHITDTATKTDIKGWIGGMRGPLQSEDIAASILYAVTQPPHVNVNEILIRPVEQES